MNPKTQLLQKKTIRELTRFASKAKEEMESYLGDLELYSNPEFWKAVSEADAGKINTYKSIKEYASKMA